MAERVTPGDTFVCYLTRLSRWFVLLEVEGPYEDETPIFVAEDARSRSGSACERRSGWTSTSQFLFTGDRIAADVAWCLRRDANPIDIVDLLHRLGALMHDQVRRRAMKWTWVTSRRAQQFLGVLNCQERSSRGASALSVHSSALSAPDTLV